ncbi:hypothetical protein GEMRC1_004346 [Eukaryota sp. GEM-RC1]
MPFSRSASLINLNLGCTSPSSESRHKDIPLKYWHNKASPSNFDTQQKSSNASDTKGDSGAWFSEDIVSPSRQPPPKQLLKSQSFTTVLPSSGPRTYHPRSLLLRRNQSSTLLGITSPSKPSWMSESHRSSLTDSTPNEEDKSFLTNPRHNILHLSKPESPCDRSMSSLFGDGSSSTNFFKLSSTIIESATQDLDSDSYVSNLSLSGFDDF